MKHQNGLPPDEHTTSTPRAEERGLHYVGWLDGIRAICSTYVVCHHIYIGTYRTYNTDPYPGLGWLSFGQLAVVAFIVISGYSLALKPLHNNLTLKEGTFGFFQRRAWRILPPYWAALLLAMAYHVLIQRDLIGHEALRSFLVHAFLLQDVLHNHAPNGAFWSIAVEAQIYLLFPIILLLSRTSGVACTVGSLSALTIFVHVATRHLPVLEKLDHLSPQLFIAYLIGYLAAWLSRMSHHRMTLRFLSATSLIAFFIYLDVSPVMDIEHNYYWLDIIFAGVTGLAFMALSWDTGILRYALDRLSHLGSISYSVYLTHLIILHPILLFVNNGAGTSIRLTEMYCLGVPAALIGGSLFFLAFERPFLTIRSWSSLWRSCRDHALARSSLSLRN